LARAQFLGIALTLAVVLSVVGITIRFMPNFQALGPWWAYALAISSLVIFGIASRFVSDRFNHWMYVPMAVLTLGSLLLAQRLQSNQGLQILTFIVAIVLAFMTLSFQNLLPAFAVITIIDIGFVSPFVQPTPPMSDSMVLITFAVMLLGAGLVTVRILTVNRQADLAAYVNELATRDPLTGLLNRRGLEADVPLLTESASRLVIPVVVTLVDLDRLKAINDSRGHGAGDDAIQCLGTCLKGNVRASDLAARIGGDEFIIVSHGNTAVHEELLARVRKDLRSKCTEVPWWDGAFTAGSASSLLSNHTISDLVEMADQQLNERKATLASARNSVRE
jgi:diguanylate cyclase (GGDEF)-like protein